MMSMTAAILTALVCLFLFPLFHKLGIPFQISMAIGGSIVLGGVFLVFRSIDKK
jgi:predicted membrane chloride channel (bestrophin family)